MQTVAKGSPPWDILGDAGIQLRKEVLMGRPLGHSGFPVSLYEPDLAMLERRIGRSGDDNVSLFPDAAGNLDVSKEFFDGPVGIHIDEATRKSSSRAHLVNTFLNA